jgi:endoglucanase
VYVAVEALRRLDGVNVALVAAAQEELGAEGARAAMHRLRPDVAVALDVTYATDVGTDSPSTGGHHVLGGGPAIFRGPAVNPQVLELLLETAREEAIDHTVEVGAKTHTDADATFSSREGVPTGLVSIPLRHMHSPNEIVQLADLEACIRLLVAFARRLKPGATYSR